MIRGIAIMGLNGCGKSTLAHALAKEAGFFEMDVEDYYFPHQRASRRRSLEGEVLAGGADEEPFAIVKSKDEVQRAMLGDMDEHGRFVLSGVTMNWCDEICSRIEAVFLLEAPKMVRLERIQQREVNRFGARVLPGGDMFAQQEQFRKMAEEREPELSAESAARIGCPVVILDGTLPPEQVLSQVMEYLNGR